MNGPSLSNYLRMHRRKLGFHQEDVLILLGGEDRSMISRHERGNRMPKLDVALRYEVIYQRPVSELFFASFERAEQDVRERAAHLIARTEAVDSQTTKRLESLMHIVGDNGLDTIVWEG